MNEFVLVTKDELKKLIRDEISGLKMPKESQQKKRYLLEEAAEYLSMPINTLRFHRDKIGGSKLGKRWTFSQEELDLFVESNRRTSKY